MIQGGFRCNSGWPQGLAGCCSLTRCIRPRRQKQQQPARRSQNWCAASMTERPYTFLNTVKVMPVYVMSTIGQSLIQGFFMGFDIRNDMWPRTFSKLQKLDDCE